MIDLFLSRLLRLESTSTTTLDSSPNATIGGAPPVADYDVDGTGEGSVGGLRGYNDHGDGDHDQGISSLGAILVACFTLFVNIIFFTPAFLARRRRRRLAAQTAAAQRLADAVQEDSHAAAQTKATRYANIESWVVSRKMLPHDHLCTKLQKAKQLQASTKDRASAYAKKRTSTVDTAAVSDDELAWEETTEKSNPESNNSTEADDSNGALTQNKNDASDTDDAQSTQEHECPICFDCFRPGDVVSWSLDPECKHFFHHNCIKEWLLKHEGCPFCRATFLPVDDAAMRQLNQSGHSAMQHVNMLLLAHNERTRACFCCMDHGMVYLPSMRPTSVSASDWMTLTERGLSAPSMEELKNLRGNPDEGSDDDDKDASSGSHDIVEAVESIVQDVDHIEPRHAPSSSTINSSLEEDDALVISAVEQDGIDSDSVGNIASSQPNEAAADSEPQSSL